MPSTLPSKTPTEDKVVTFDFSTEAATAATLSGPTVAKSLSSGTDTGAATLTVGTPSVTGQTVLALVSAGTDGNKYELICTATASNGEVHQIAATLMVSLGAI